MPRQAKHDVRGACPQGKLECQFFFSSPVVRFHQELRFALYSQLYMYAIS